MLPYMHKIVENHSLRKASKTRLFLSYPTIYPFMRLLFVLATVFVMVSVACAQEKSREELVIEALSSTASDMGWGSGVRPMQDWSGWNSPGKGYQVAAGPPDHGFDKAFLVMTSEDKAAGVLDEFQLNGLKRRSFRGYDAVQMSQGEKVCDAGGTVGFVLDWVRKGAKFIAEQLEVEDFDEDSICGEATGTVVWVCGDLVFGANSPDSEDNSQEIASTLYSHARRLKLCEYDLINGTVVDMEGVAMAYLDVQVGYDGKNYGGFTDDKGYYEVRVKGLEPSTRDPPKLEITYKMKYVRDGINYFEIIGRSSHPDSVEVTREFEFRSAADLVQDFNFNIAAPANAQTHSSLSTNDRLNNLRHYSIIYRHTHEALDFALVKLKANVNYKLPVEVYVGWSDGTYYNPNAAYIAIQASHAGFSHNYRPKNREYHEFGHHLMFAQYGNWPDGRYLPNTKNHDGYINPSTADSYMEGFAEFYALLVSEYMNDSQPEVYSVFGSLENNYKAWSEAGRYEEFAVAGVLWDLYDDNDDSGDTISLTLDEMWKVLKVKRKDFYEYYKAFKQEYPDKSKQIDDVFIAHGFFHDTREGNRRWDAGEPLRDNNSNSVHDPGEEYVDLGTPPELGRPWQIYSPGEIVGKATNYARANRSLAVVLDDAYIRAADPSVRKYTVRVEYRVSADGRPYEYCVDAVDGLIYLSPLPEDVDATYTVSVASPAYRSSAPYRISSQDYSSKLRNSFGKGSADSHDFAVVKVGEDKSGEGDLDSVKPELKNKGDEFRDGDKNPSGGICCIPGLTILLALAASLSHKLISP